MPRERFRHQHEISQNPDEPHVAMPQVDVSWGREYPGVQIGVVAHTVETKAWLQRTLEDVVPDASQREAVVERLTEPHSGALGWYTELGRAESNRLIRVLRKARDAAFGADA